MNIKKISMITMTGLLTAASLTVLSPSGIAHSAENNNCSKIAVAIPGGGQSLTMDTNSLIPTQMQNITQQLKNDGYKTKTVSYDAAPFFLNNYETSVQEGKKIVSQEIKKIVNNCANPQVSLIGYSEGADIASHIVKDITNDKGPIKTNNLHKVVLVANPHHGTQGTIKRGTAAESQNGVLKNFNNQGGFGSNAQKVTEICNKNDYVCSDQAAIKIDFVKNPLLQTNVSKGILLPGIIDTIKDNTIDKAIALNTAGKQGLTAHNTSYNQEFNNIPNIIKNK